LRAVQWAGAARPHDSADGSSPRAVRLPLHALQSRGNQAAARPGRAVLNAK
jgi:hypothetical protein